jgi:hypothetical protein
MRDHLGQIMEFQTVRLHHMQQGVGRRVRVAAAGVVLERGLGRGPPRAQAVHQAARIGIARHASGHALRAFQNVGRAREAVFGQVGRHEARCGRMRGVQLLAVGSGAQKLPQARRLRARRAQRVQHLLRIQAQQVAHSGSRGQRARGARGVEHAVVRAPQKLTHANTDFIAHDRSGQQLLAAGAQGLGHRHSGREHHGGRVEHRAVVHIVLLGHVRRSGIGHGRQIRRGACAVDDDFGRTFSRPHRLRKARDGFHRARAVPGHGRAEPVDQQVFDLANHRLGDVFKAQAGCEGGELSGM